MTTLSSPFPPHIIRSRPGQGGSLDYIPAWAIIERLNAVLGLGGWSWLSSVQIGESHVVATGSLSLGEASYQGEDAAPIESGRDGLANAIKTASTGALVRAARLLGVGLYLYHQDVDSEEPADHRSPSIGRQLHEAAPEPDRHTSDLPPYMQLLVEAAKILDWDADALARRSKKAFGCHYRELDPDQSETLRAELEGMQVSR